VCCDACVVAGDDAAAQGLSGGSDLGVARH
jgi:hypothetical protein